MSLTEEGSKTYRRSREPRPSGIVYEASGSVIYRPAETRMEHYDILLIGAGPIGIECAVHLKRHGSRYLHLEAGAIGATINWYAPGTHFFSSPERLSIAGVPLLTENQGKPTREEYLRYLRGVVTQHDLEIGLYTLVTSLRRDKESFVATYVRHPAPAARVPAATLDWGTEVEATTVRAKRVILAVGDMHRPNRLGVPGEDLPHVSHYFGDPHTYFRRTVLIVGGRNSAIEAAIRLSRMSCDVTVCHRGGELDRKRIKYWLYPEMISLVSTHKIRLLSETMPVEITPADVLLRRRDGTTLTLRPDHVLLLTGYEQDPSLFRQLGVELEGENERPVLNGETHQSASVPGVFVIGTATAGSQRTGVKEFIETSHVHVARVVRHLFGDELESRPVNPDDLEN